MPIIGPTVNHKEIRHWAESHGAIPTELLPHLVDHEPAELRFILEEQSKDHPNARALSWEEFFLKFDGLGLAFVYDDDSSGYNEILQRKETPLYRDPEYPVAGLQN